MKNLVFPILFLSLLVTAFSSENNNDPVEETLGIKKIVLDAGHGGHDPGALGKNCKEKDIALAITLKVGKMIEEKIPSIEVIYTRDKDEFIPLNKRAEIANLAKADLFVSIHCNANASSSPKGTETYVMGADTKNQNLEVMNRENEVIEKEENHEQNYDVDINDPKAVVPLLFLLKQYKNQSLEMAGAIQSNFQKNTSRSSRGVKEARFYVLLRTYMPSVLIEAGFISNIEEETYLKSENGQNQIAKGIFDAIYNYQKQYSSVLPKDPTVKPRQNTGNNDAAQKNIIPSVFQSETPVFSVQLMSSKLQIKTTDPPFSVLDNILEAQYGELYKYYYGHTKNIDDAIQLQSTAREKGFKDAFVVAFHLGKKITVSKAKELIKLD